MSDPLTHVRRKLAIVTKDKDVLNFFDDEIIHAIQKREQSYINRMTKIFTSQFIL